MTRSFGKRIRKMLFMIASSACLLQVVTGCQLTGNELIYNWAVGTAGYMINHVVNNQMGVTPSLFSL